MYVCMYGVCISTRMYNRQPDVSTHQLCVYVSVSVCCVYACMCVSVTTVALCVCMYARMHTNKPYRQVARADGYLGICMCVYMNACMYVCTRVHTYAYTHI
jgi:hypothetical protein